MINFKEYLTENWGNLKVFDHPLAKILQTEYGAGSTSKVVKTRKLSDVSKAIKGDNVPNAIVVDGRLFTLAPNGKWTGKSSENYMLLKDVKDFKEIYLVYPDNEAWLKKLNKPSPLPTRLQSFKIPIDNFMLLYNSRIKSIIKKIEKKYGVKYKKISRSKWDEYYSLPHPLPGKKAPDDILIFKHNDDKIFMSEAKKQLDFLRALENTHT